MLKITALIKMSTMPLAVVLLTDVGVVSIAVQHEVVNLMLYYFGLIKKNDYYK